MKALLWREWHWNRVIVLAGIVIFVIPYGVAMVFALWPKINPPGTFELAYAFASAALFSCGISQLTISFLGGNAMAGERSDRSAEFMAYLPFSRFQRLLSKLSLTAIVALVVWAVNWFVIWLLFDHLDGRMRETLPDLFPPKYTATTSLLMFGVAWLVSSFQSSPTIAIGAGLLAPVMISMGLAMLGWADVIEDREAQKRLFTVVYPNLALVLGVLGFAAGTAYFLKRVEP